MTILFSACLPDFIVMAADSAVTIDYSDSTREYQTGPKAYPFPGVGCVTTWGARDHNRIGRFLKQELPSSESVSVVQLSKIVDKYLTEEYRPHELDLEDVGYHVAGFDPNGSAHLYHVFWGFDRPRPKHQTHQMYKKYEHMLPPEDNIFLYNGRNELAELVVYALLREMQQGKDVRFDITTPEGLVLFGDFVVRFAAELTPEVGPPFLIHMISRENRIEKVINRNFNPIDGDEVQNKLEILGVRLVA
jgi:hypothetical protein